MQLGEKLKSVRETQSLKLDKISERTKINITFLTNFEKGKFDFLPGLYVRNFLKLYLNELGESTAGLLDEYDFLTGQEKTEADNVTDEHLKEFNNRVSYKEKITPIIKEIKQHVQDKKFYLMGIAAIICLLVIYSLSNLGNDEPQMVVQDTTKTIAVQESTSNSMDTSSLFVKNLFSSPKKLKLELEAIEKTWLQLAIDDSAATEHIFEKGDIFYWLAKEKYLLRIGNGAGIKLILNGKDLGSLGKEGEVVILVLTKDGIQENTF